MIDELKKVIESKIGRQIEGRGDCQFLSDKINEELNESDKDLIRKIIRQEVSAIFFDLFKKRKSWGA